MSVIPLIIVIVYLVLLFGASAISARIMKKKATTGQGFLNANKGLSTAMIAAMIAGMAIGGSATVGVAQSAMDGGGMSAGMYTPAWTAAAVVMGLVVSTRARKLNIVTLPGLFQNCFGGTAKILMTIGQLVIMLAVTALQYVAGGAILSAMLPQYFTYTSGMIFTAVCFVGVTVIGGMLGASYTNIINMIVIYLGLIVGVISAVTNFGGFDALSTALVETSPETPWFSLTAGVGIPVILGWIVTMVTSVNSTQQNIQVGLSARSDKDARRGLVWGAIIMLPVGFLSAVFGLIAAVDFPEINSASALPVVAMTLNPVVAGLLLSGLWAADISTGVGLLLGASNVITHDIIDPMRKDGQGSSLLVSRLCVLGVGIVTIFLALSISSILGTIMTAQAICAGICIIFFFLLYKPSLCKKSSATITMAVAYILLIIWLIVPESHVVADLIYLEWPICLVVFFLTAIFDKRKIVDPAEAMKKP